MVRWFMIALGISALFLSVLQSPVEAKKRHRHHHAKVDANGNRLFALVRTASGETAEVIASARAQFQGFINAIEQDRREPETGVLERGNRISDIGCRSRGHMPGSKHHWGGACDFSQRRRNVTQSFMYRVSAIAARFGLVDGCEWSRKRGERYTGPDCGHIEVPGPNIARRNESYRMAAH